MANDVGPSNRPTDRTEMITMMIILWEWVRVRAVDGWMEMRYRRGVDWLRVVWVLLLNTTCLSSIGLVLLTGGGGGGGSTGVVSAAARVSREERLQSVQRLLSEVPLIDG